jgi:formylglycine-generating enzyme required for sulfatase activity
MPPGKAKTARQAAEILFSEHDSIRRALVLVLGEYDAPNAPARQQEPLIAVLLDLYVNDPDAGIHAAAEWTLRRWQQNAALAAADARLRGANRGDRRWYLSPEGLTFSVIDPPGEFIMGSRPEEPWKRVHEPAHRRLLQRRYAISSKEVTVAQFAQFLQADPKRRKQFGRSEADPSYPQANLSWFDAAAFCNWLSAREGLTPCYVPNKDDEFGPGMSVKPDALTLNGYRLPTEAEWEYAARAGAATSRSYGNSARLLSRYAWSVTSSGDRLHPGGLLRPNDLGLFDVLGNVTEWTQNEARDYPASDANPAEDALDPGTAIDSKIPRVLRGGSYLDRDDDVRVMRRDRTEPGDRYPTYGVRPVRTIP